MIVLKIISLVIFVCLAMWSIRNLKDHDVSYATAILPQVITTTVSKGLLYSTGGPCGAVHNSIDNWNNNAQCLLFQLSIELWTAPHGPPVEYKRPLLTVVFIT